MRTVETTGRTVEEAVEASLEELGVEQKNVEIEILEEPNRGLFGILGSKPGKSAGYHKKLSGGHRPPVFIFRL